MKKMKKAEYLSIPLAVILFHVFVFILLFGGHGDYYHTFINDELDRNMMKAIITASFALAVVSSSFAVAHITKLFCMLSTKKCVKVMSIVFAANLLIGAVSLALVFLVTVILRSADITPWHWSIKYTVLFLLDYPPFSFALLPFILNVFVAASAIYMLAAWCKRKHNKSFKAVITSFGVVLMAALAALTASFFHTASNRYLDSYGFYFGAAIVSLFAFVGIALLLIGLYYKRFNKAVIKGCVCFLLFLGFCTPFIVGFADFTDGVVETVKAEIAVVLIGFTDEEYVYMGKDLKGNKLYLCDNFFTPDEIGRELNKEESESGVSWRGEKKRFAGMYWVKYRYRKKEF